jgi:hypothetical protein
VGLDFVHDRGTSGKKHLVETMGAGLSWLDYDGDGWWDLYLVQSGPFPPVESGGPPNRLYRNLEGTRFVDVTAESGVGDTGCGQGSLAADLDGNGATDLVVTNYGPDVMLTNRGDGRFERDKTVLNARESNWSSSAAAGDADGDGDLDLYVSRYILYYPDDVPFCGDPETGALLYCDPSLFVGLPDRFFINQGEGGWLEASESAGIASLAGRGLGVAFADLDGDRLQDIYVANDLDANILFHNQGDGVFEDVSLFSGSGLNLEGKPEAGMGVMVRDLNGDRLFDLLVTNFDVETNTHYENTGDLSFIDVSSRSGFGPPSFNQLAFGLGVADFNGDGELDVYLGNGHIFEQPRRDNTSYRQADQLLLGDGTGRFRALACPLLGDRLTVSRGVALGDYDNDGDADIGVQENDGPFALVENRMQGGDWVGVQLAGRGPNSEGIGAHLELMTSGRRLVQQVMAGDSYQSSSDRRLLFSLVPGESVEALEIVWPSGERQRFDRPPVRHYLTIRQGGRDESPVG